MDKNEIDGSYNKLLAKLKIDCENCSGLCCVALYCMKTDGFPANKESGVPCKHLEPDFRCDIHSELIRKNMHGCLAYDCFGAGQKVTQRYKTGVNWKSDSDKADEIFKVFLIVFQLHQMEWYLIESLSLTFNENLKSDIKELIAENERMTAQKSCEILNLDVEQYRNRVNKKLKQVSESLITASSECGKDKDYFAKDFRKANLEGRDFSMSLMIAANLEGCKLRNANFLGADMRDANIRNTDLSESLFLTQMQINSAIGNTNTKLPEQLSYPVSWRSL